MVSMSRSKSEEQVMEQVMERHYDIDLTYITERIISVFFMPELEEQRYHAELQEMATMLKSKHQDKFLVGHAKNKTNKKTPKKYQHFTKFITPHAGNRYRSPASYT